jgi:FkbH-like protein
MHLLTSNFNLLHSNSSWSLLKKNNFHIDKDFDNFFLLINDKKVLEKYETIHIILNFNYSNKNELIKKVKYIIKNFDKIKNIFIYISSVFSKKKSEKLFQFLDKKTKIIYFQFLIHKEIKFNSRNQKFIKFPYEIRTIELISDVICKNIKIYKSKPYKLIILDCDNTLWGGILDEDGVKNLIFSNNAEGIIYKNFQIFLKSLKDKGFILSISSKNNEKNVWKAMKNRQMILQKKDFINPKINWLEKDLNITKILTNLSLRAEDTLFIDDNLIEIQKVKTSIKSINYIQFNKKTIFKTLNEDLRLKKFKILKEDKIKYKQYQLKSSFEDLKEKEKNKLNTLKFMKSLKQKVKLINFTKKNFDRAFQLIHKTNQFNLSLNRYNNFELKNIINNKDFSTKLVDFKDKFGDHGLIGLYIYKKEKNSIRIIDFLLSCRILYRGIEDYMIYSILNLNVNKNILIDYKPSILNNKLTPLFLKKDFFKIYKKTNKTKIFKISDSKSLNETKKIFN